MLTQERETIAQIISLLSSSSFNAQHGALGVIKHLAIPRTEYVYLFHNSIGENKTILIAMKVHERVLSCIQTESEVPRPIHLSCLSILKQLADSPTFLTSTNLVDIVGFIFSNFDVAIPDESYEGIRCESSRIIVRLLKVCDSEQTYPGILFENHQAIMKMLAYLLASEFPILIVEAAMALAILFGHAKAMPEKEELDKIFDRCKLLTSEQVPRLKEEERKYVSGNCESLLSVLRQRGWSE